MEVDQNKYKKELLPILQHIANASFVSFDLEMSGIHKNSRFGPTSGGHSNGKPSLQQIYDETRIAAETFQVLQVGITCIEEDREKGYYLARPYNFNLSPLFFLDNRIKDRFPERKIVFSSSAADFLQGEGFDIGKVFSSGVYYLSHAEEEETRERNRRRTEQQSSKVGAVIRQGDTKALEFYRNARKTISTWVNAEKPEHSFVNIGDDKGGDLNGYQRLLVHQLVQNEFPGYRSFARNKQSFIQIEKVDPKREALDKAKKVHEFNSVLAKQIGLRWIFEALTGGDLSGIPSTWFSEESDKHPELSQKIVDKEFAEIKAVLKNKQHVIVGHNLFTDLVCLYKTFIGPLPATVEDFQERVHSIFPIVIDSKYLATEGHDSMSTVMRKSLAELVEPFKKIHTPLVVLHEQHTSYGATLGKKHEAGFDSWMTAELFIKMSSKVYADRKRTEIFDSDSNESLPYYLAEPCMAEQPLADQSFASEDDSGGGGAKLNPDSPEEDLMDMSDPTSEATKSTPLNDNLPPAYHANQLQKLKISDSNPYSVLQNGVESTGSGADDSSAEEESVPTQWIPKMESSFWDLYANKLRVNSSDKGVCDLN